MSMRDCIDHCIECHRICLETAVHALQRGDGSHPSHVRLLLDCAEICQTSANFMLRGSDLHPQTCAACAEICQRCAEDCDRMGQDAQMRRCAEICRRCAADCREMSQKVAA